MEFFTVLEAPRLAIDFGGGLSVGRCQGYSTCIHTRDVTMQAASNISIFRKNWSIDFFAQWVSMQDYLPT